MSLVFHKCASTSHCLIKVIPFDMFHETCLQLLVSHSEQSHHALSFSGFRQPSQNSIFLWDVRLGMDFRQEKSLHIFFFYYFTITIQRWATFDTSHSQYGSMHSLYFFPYINHVFLPFSPLIFRIPLCLTFQLFLSLSRFSFQSVAQPSNRKLFDTSLFICSIPNDT